jgi:Domain of unknown function (DUF4124)
MMQSAVVASLLAFAIPGALLAQQIQRCEDSRGRITYSNTDCPDGTKPVKALQAAPAPSPEALQAAREKAAREAQAAQQLGQERQQQQSIATAQQQSQRDADCAYLRGEIDSMRRLRNALVNRPFYSLDDLDQMDRHVAGLQDQYRRVCGP